MKTCTKCKAEKPEAEFTVQKAKKGGLHSWCRACNICIGYADDSPERLISASDYLKNNS